MVAGEALPDCECWRTLPLGIKKTSPSRAPCTRPNDSAPAEESARCLPRRTSLDYRVPRLSTTVPMLTGVSTVMETPVTDQPHVW